MMWVSLQLQDVTECVLLLPNEQLGEASPDGAVGECALADVINLVDCRLQGNPIGAYVAQLLHQFDLVTVVQRS